MGEATPLVELAGVSVARAESLTPMAVVRNVDWAICPGDFWVVGGLAGTGKTDLLATAAGLQKPLEGTHLLFGRDTRQMHEDELVSEKLKIGFVFGSGRLFPTTTIAENLALPICYHQNCTYEEAEPQVLEALQKTGLEHLAHKRPHEVNRNIHQRIGLARALALRPEILMLDNPLLGVDPRQGRWWIDFLCSLAGEKAGEKRKTVVVATDDLRPWKDVARQFALIKNKEWVAVGSREELTQYKDPIVHELMS